MIKILCTELFERNHFGLGELIAMGGK